MKGKMDIVYRSREGGEKAYSPSRYMNLFEPEEAEKVKDFHRSFSEYEETPLIKLKGLAEFYGIGDIYIKDESKRFGLNAFKALGGSYCIGKYMQDHETGAKQLTFVTATDGNHGRGIAWTARKLGQRCVVYMPKGSAEERLENIKKLGAEAYITDMNYDDAVRHAKKMADEKGWIMVQDTAWEGYEQIPSYIMQGYMTMASEAVSQLKEETPTHVFLQAGVGAMSGAVTAFLRNFYGGICRPEIIIVEPDKADCIYRTAFAKDGRLRFVKGDMDTIMAGLACGEPCTIGWDILDREADAFISMTDNIAARGMRILANPVGEDRRVVSGESGAAAMGAISFILEDQELRQRLKIDDQSKILCFSTEGDTDRENYRRIVWDGAYPSF